MTFEISTLIWVAAAIAALSIHEYAHSWAATKLGDPTPRLSGRLTLDPRAHTDPLGILFLLLFGFGWGKPVPVNPANFADPQKDMALTALAGPASNFLLATVLALVARVFGNLLPILLPVIILNLNWGFFNVIPLAPLDGARLVSGILPPPLANQWERMRAYSPLLLLILFLPLGERPFLEMILSPLLSFALQLLL